MGASRELWPDEYTVFNILYDKFLFWSIVVGLFTFAWLLIAILRYRDGIEPAGKEELKVGTFPKERHNFDLELAWFVGPTILVVWVGAQSRIRFYEHCLGRSSESTGRRNIHR